MSKFIALIALFMLTGAFGAPKHVTLTKQNMVLIRTSISQDSVNKAMEDLHKLDKARKNADETPIYLVLDSPGGSIFAGLAFIRFAKHIKNLHTITMNAASMAHAIVQALPGTRYVLEDGILMAHRAKGGFRGQFENGEVESRLKIVKEVVRLMERRNAERIGISLKDYKLKVINEWWSLGKIAIEENVADELVEVTCSNELVEETYEVEVRTFFGSGSVEYSKCPLFQ